MRSICHPLDVEVSLPWYSPMTFWSRQTKSLRQTNPEPSSAMTSTLSSGSGSPWRTNSSRDRVSIADAEPTRIHRSASRRARTPRTLPRRATARCSSSTDSARPAIWSPITTRSSTPRRAPRSTQTSAPATTRTPETVATHLCSRPRWGLTCGRSIGFRMEARMTCRGWACSWLRGSGRSWMSAAVQCEKTASRGRTSEAARAAVRAARMVGDEGSSACSATSVASSRTPWRGRRRSVPRSRPSFTPASRAVDVVKAPDLNGSGRRPGRRGMAASVADPRHTSACSSTGTLERVAFRCLRRRKSRSATLSTTDGGHQKGQALRAWPIGAPGRIRTCATASGGRCSIP